MNGTNIEIYDTETLSRTYGLKAELLFAEIRMHKFDWKETT
jgi:hypothetical protein